MKRGGEANMLDNNKTMQEIYSICKKFEEMRLFSKKIPFNSSELQLLKQVVVASEQGQKPDDFEEDDTPYAEEVK